MTHAGRRAYEARHSKIREKLFSLALFMLLCLKPLSALAEEVKPALPNRPLITELPVSSTEEISRSLGKRGGEIHTLVGRAKDIRLITAWGYARLVGYQPDLRLAPDILEEVLVEQEGRRFTFRLREGHRWSDGRPFTAEDFRYWWEDVANNPELSPAGPPHFMRVKGELPVFEVLDLQTVRYSWKAPNPVFLPTLAQARPPFIYRPAHYLSPFHKRYGDPKKIAEEVAARKLRGWASLHNAFDSMYDADNPDLPTLQPWRPARGNTQRRAVMIRNPHFHRVDSAGQQLPYLDRIIMNVVDGRLIPVKTQAGESMLQARNLTFSDMTVLKKGAKEHGYHVYLWPISKGGELVLFPNLTIKDPKWRQLFQDKRFRHALSLGIDRTTIARVLYFGLVQTGNNTVLQQSPLYRPLYRTKWAEFNPEEANRLLDEIGFVRRRTDGIRLFPDDTPLEIIVETSGERAQESDALQLIAETWKEIGVALQIKPSQRDVIRDRALAGTLMMSIGEGYNNGIPTADMPPTELAPLLSEMLNWSSWGDYYESAGHSGTPPELLAAHQLVELYEDWLQATISQERALIWHAMLSLHAEETFSIGVVCGALQPVIVDSRLRNVPKEGIYGWDPGAHYGIHRMDLFWLDTDDGKTRPSPLPSIPSSEDKETGG